MKKSKKDYGLLRTSGDEGVSDLFSGEKISKASPRLEALGELDELGSTIGLVKLYVDAKFHDEFLQIQRILFVIGAELATVGKATEKLPQTVNAQTLQWLEICIQNLLKWVVVPKGFILSGSTPGATYLHLARSVTRRCERRLVALYQKKQLKNKNILAFLNRLSVYFFILAVAHDTNPIMVKEE